MSGREKYIENDLDKEVRRILNLDTKFRGERIGKKIIYHLTILIFTLD